MWHAQPCLNRTQCLFVEPSFAVSYGRSVVHCENVNKNTFKKFIFEFCPSPGPLCKVKNLARFHLAGGNTKVFIKFRQSFYQAKYSRYFTAIF